jgi:hypothetical protein
VILHWNPETSAKWHGDLFLLEELTQVKSYLRSSLVWMGYREGEDDYCDMAVWTRMNLLHWTYVRRCADALANEAGRRFRKYYHVGYNDPPAIDSGQWVNPPIEVPAEFIYRSIPNTHLNWYLAVWKDKWTS